MNLKTLAFCLLAALGGSAAAQEIPGIDIEGPFVRVQKNEDGTRTIYERGNDKRSLTKRIYNAKGNVVMTTVYRLDDNANPRKCDVFDVQGNRIYKTSFGYSRVPGVTYGKLVQERLFRISPPYTEPNPKTGKREEAPVHIIYYRYNADGSPMKPVGETRIKGKTAEEVFGHGIESQVLPRKMSELEPINPNAEPLRR